MIFSCFLWALALGTIGLGLGFKVMLFEDSRHFPDILFPIGGFIEGALVGLGNGVIFLVSSHQLSRFIRSKYVFGSLAGILTTIWPLFIILIFSEYVIIENLKLYIILGPFLGFLFSLFQRKVTRLTRERVRERVKSQVDKCAEK